MKENEIVNSEASATERSERVANRLRESRDSYLNQNRKQAHEQGRLWAEQDAEWRELWRLNDFLPEMPDPYNVHYAIEWNAQYDSNEEAVQAADDWWDSVLGEGGKKLVWEEGFLDSFIEGALEVWREVKNKL
jgi:hypothetical protein